MTQWSGAQRFCTKNRWKIWNKKLGRVPLVIHGKSQTNEPSWVGLELCTEKDLPKQRSIAAAKVLRVLRPTLAQVSELEMKQKEMTGFCLRFWVMADSTVFPPLLIKYGFSHAVGDFIGFAACLMFFQYRFEPCVSFHPSPGFAAQGRWSELADCWALRWWCLMGKIMELTASKCLKMYLKHLKTIRKMLFYVVVGEKNRKEQGLWSKLGFFFDSIYTLPHLVQRMMVVNETYCSRLVAGWNNTCHLRKDCQHQGHYIRLDYR